MLIRQNSAVIATVLITCFIQPLPANSQTSNETQGAGNADPADTIVVSAARSPLALSNIGSSVTVINRQQIERQQARYVSDLLTAVPGVAVSRSGPIGAQTQVRFRGAEANHVLVLIDGVEANDPASGDEFRWELLTTGNVERIEIVRGPQSALWGSDALAGVVNVITRTTADSPTIGGYAESGSNSAINAGVQGRTASERWSVGFGLERLDTDGTNISRNGAEADGADITTASLNGQFRPSDTLTFDFGLRNVDAYSQFDPVDFFTSGLPTDGDLATDSRRNTANLGAKLSSPNGRLLQHLAFRYLDTNNENLTAGQEDSSTNSDKLSITYQADVKFENRLLSLAFEHEKTNFEQRGAIVFGDPNQTQDITVNSAVVEFLGLSNSDLSWSLSARYDDNSDFDDTLSGRASVAYQLTETTRVRANLGTGQKAPTFTERFGFFPGQFVGNPALQPESSTSYELGIEKTFVSRNLGLQLTYFDQDLEDEIDGFAFDPVTFLFTAENLSGSSSRRGVELAARADVTASLEMSASYTYTDTSETGTGGITADELRRPRHAGNLAANYAFADQRGNLSFAANYGGSRLDRFFPPFPAAPQVVTLSHYWLADFTASFALNPRLTVFGRVSNLLDEDYEQVFGYQTLGRVTYFGLRANFGR